MQHRWIKLAVILGGVFAWVIILPAIMMGVTIYFNPGYRFYADSMDLPQIIPGIVLLVSGMSLALSAIYSQYKIGQGTPVPLLPTVKLVVKGPYRYTRNPMALGVILMLFGAAIALWSIPAVTIAILVSSAHVLYDKFIEERELENRFGEAYSAYKKRTPFLIPRIFSRSRNT